MNFNVFYELPHDVNLVLVTMLVNNFINILRIVSHKFVINNDGCASNGGTHRRGNIQAMLRRGSAIAKDDYQSYFMKHSHVDSAAAQPQESHVRMKYSRRRK